MKFDDNRNNCDLTIIKRSRNRSRSRSNTKENCDDNFRINAKYRLSHNNNKSKSFESASIEPIIDDHKDDLSSDKNFNLLDKAGLRITIDNDKYMQHNDNNNNNKNMINFNNNRYKNFQNDNCHQYPQSGIHSRLQSIPKAHIEPPPYIKNPPKTPPLITIPPSILPLMQPKPFIHSPPKRDFNYSSYQQSNNIVIDCNSKTNNIRFDQNNNNRNGYQGNLNNTFPCHIRPVGFNNNNKPPLINNIVNRPALPIYNKNSLPTKKQNSLDNECWDDEDDVDKDCVEIIKRPSNETNQNNKSNISKYINSSSTPKEKSFTTNDKSLKNNNSKNKSLGFDFEYWDDDDDSNVKKNGTPLDNFTKPNFTFTNDNNNNNKIKISNENINGDDGKKYKNNKKFHYNDRDAPSSSTNGFVKNGMF
jgi:hypothetical protein